MTSPVIQIAPLYKEIYDRLAANTAHVNVIRGFANTGDDLERMVDRQTLVPVMFLTMGSPGEDSFYGGIASGRLDPKVVTFSVMAVADDYWQCLQIIDVANSMLSGYIPANGSEISLVPSVARVPVTSVLNPLRYAQTCGFYLTLDPA